MSPAELTAAIEHALLTVLTVEDFELTEGFGGAGIDVSGDDWTWHVEDGLSYLALDDEPEDESALPGVIDRALTMPVITAFQTIDPVALAELTALLRASADPLSIAFAQRLQSS